MNGFMMHCGGEVVTRKDVENIPVPEHTDTWKPVPYGDAISYLHEQADKRLGLPVRKEHYGLNKDGKQLFALLVLDTGSETGGLAIGHRGSYDKSLANACAVGKDVFVCDNLMFSGSAFVVVRKNTVNVWIDFTRMIATQLDNALGHYKKIEEQEAMLRGKPCNDRRGYAMLGVAYGEGILTSTQASVAFGDWKKPRHEQFTGRNLWSLYNCMTEGLKKGTPGRLLDRHTRAHDFVIDMAQR
jgi:hypothetical protein